MTQYTPRGCEGDRCDDQVDVLAYCQKKGAIDQILASRSAVCTALEAWPAALGGCSHDAAAGTRGSRPAYAAAASRGRQQAAEAS